MLISILRVFQLFGVVILPHDKLALSKSGTRHSAHEERIVVGKVVIGYPAELGCSELAPVRGTTNFVHELLYRVLFALVACA